jgi:hypothetical protein
VFHREWHSVHVSATTDTEGRTTTMVPTCPYCESSRRIPVIFGNTRDVALDLFDQGRIALGGSLLVGDLETWECADCWTRYGSRKDEENEQHYLATIEQTFDDYKAASSNERRTAKALWILRMITFRLFETGISQVRFESTPRGMRAMVEVASRWEDTPLPPASLLEPIVWLVENHPGSTTLGLTPPQIDFDARIAKTDKKFKLTRHADLPFLAFSISVVV